MIDALRERLTEATARGLADAVSHAIRDGALADGDKLPPIRTVGRELGLSPTTVSSAWALLARAGTISTDGRRGTVVALRHSPGPTRYRRVLAAGSPFELDLSTGVPDPELLPDLTAVLGNLPSGAASGSYLDDPVLPGLLDVLRADWPYPAERFTIVDGAMDALDLVANGLIRFGDRVAVEHPCFPPLLDLLDAVGARVVGVPMDDEGLIASRLAAVLGEVRAVFLQPRAQNPTGASLSSGRAEELAAVLKATDVLVVEDDSAGAIAQTAAVSLGRLLPERTVHIRSFSKSHGPDLRLAAVSGPADVIDPLVERRFLGQSWTSRLLQATLLGLLTSSVSVAQVHTAREEYARRRRLVVDALATAGVVVGGADGLNIWLPVRDEAAASIRLASQGIGAAAGGPFSVLPTGTAHLRVTVGLVRAEHDRVAAQLAEAALVEGWTGPR